MPDISITDEQLARLEQVQQDVADAFVEGYGHIRPKDAIDYLLDTYQAPDEMTAYDRIGDADRAVLVDIADDVGVDSEADNADELRGRLLATLGAEEFAATLESLETTDEAAASATEDDSEAATTPPEAPESTANETSTNQSEEAIATGETDSLAEVNKLLQEHDDKWRENDGEAPYEVDLPDGETEQARTKDDIRQLLFRHY